MSKKRKLLSNEAKAENLALRKKDARQNKKKKPREIWAEGEVLGEDSQSLKSTSGGKKSAFTLKEPGLRPGGARRNNSQSRFIVSIEKDC